MPTDNNYHDYLQLVRQDLEASHARQHREDLEMRRRGFEQTVTMTAGGGGAGSLGQHWVSTIWGVDVAEELPKPKPYRFPEYSNVSFDRLSKEPIVKEIMPGLVKINREQAKERILQHLI